MKYIDFKNVDQTLKNVQVIFLNESGELPVILKRRFNVKFRSLI